MTKDTQIQQLGIDGDSVKREVDRNIKNPFDAFNEYIWNSIDAGAKNIQIKIKKDSKHIKELSVMDDGCGIDYEQLNKRLFGKFNISPKSEEKEQKHSLPHGERGFGRFAFIKFAHDVTWKTVYEKDSNNNYQYYIKITKDSLDNYRPSVINKTKKPTGTETIFNFESMTECEALTSNNTKDILDKLKENIALEFCWIIELFDIKIKINDKLLDYDNYKEPTTKEKGIEIENEKFDFKFIKWKQQLKNQSSRYYLLNSKNNEVFVETTTLNNKGDDFYHSVYIKSSYFDDFHILKTRGEKRYTNLIKFIDQYLKEKRKPYIKKFADNKFEKFKKENILPKFNKFEEQVKKPLYERAVKDVISFAPSLVSTKTNNSQVKILLELINRLLDDDKSRNTLYGILAVLLDEENKDYLDELKRLLDNYGLKNILGTIKLIEDRLVTIELLKKMNDKNEFYCNESDLQRQIEQHFWIFGEEYHLMVCAEEDDFTKLRNIYVDQVLNKDRKEYEQNKVSRKQVDLFICGIVSEGHKTNRNLIIEIKHPNKNINFGNFRQIEDYSRIINKTNGLNNPKRDKWDFVLLCKDIIEKDKKDFDERFIDAFSGLVYDNKKNIRIFVKRWFDLLRDVEDRLKCLKDRLDIKKNKLVPTTENKESFIQKFENSARKDN